MKECFKCKSLKPFSDFYKHPKMKDGHVNKCKDCNKTDVRDNRKKNAEYYREYDIQRSKDSDRYSKKLKQSSNWKKNNDLKRKAQTKVSNEIRSGRLTRPSNCEYCGDTDHIHGHHVSYSEDFWLIVTWLCAKCHAQLHKNFEYKLEEWSD